MIIRGAIILGLAATLWPSIAGAHAYLVTSNPQHKAQLVTAPARMKLQFSEPIEPAFVKVSLQRDGKALAEPLKLSVGRDGKTVLIDSSLSVAGEYRLDWSIVARDGHRTQGSLMFSVDPR